MLGIVDPRTLSDSVDTELMALWLAHFTLKREAVGGGKAPSQQGSQTNQPRIIDHSNVDQQVSVCERLLL